MDEPSIEMEDQKIGIDDSSWAEAKTPKDACPVRYALEYGPWKEVDNEKGELILRFRFRALADRFAIFFFFAMLVGWVVTNTITDYTADTDLIQKFYHDYNPCILFDWFPSNMIMVVLITIWTTISSLYNSMLYIYSQASSGGVFEHAMIGVMVSVQFLTEIAFGNVFTDGLYHNDPPSTNNVTHSEYIDVSRHSSWYILFLLGNLGGLVAVYFHLRRDYANKVPFWTQVKFAVYFWLLLVGALGMLMFIQTYDVATNTARFNTDPSTWLQKFVRFCRNDLRTGLTHWIPAFIFRRAIHESQGIRIRFSRSLGPVRLRNDGALSACVSPERVISLSARLLFLFLCGAYMFDSPTKSAGLSAVIFSGFRQRPYNLFFVPGWLLFMYLFMVGILLTVARSIVHHQQAEKLRRQSAIRVGWHIVAGVGAAMVICGFLGTWVVIPQISEADISIILMAFIFPFWVLCVQDVHRRSVIYASVWFLLLILSASLPGNTAPSVCNILIVLQLILYPMARDPSHNSDIYGEFGDSVRVRMSRMGRPIYNLRYFEVQETWKGWWQKLRIKWWANAMQVERDREWYCNLGCQGLWCLKVLDTLDYAILGRPTPNKRALVLEDPADKDDVNPFTREYTSAVFGMVEFGKYDKVLEATSKGTQPRDGVFSCVVGQQMVTAAAAKERFAIRNQFSNSTPASRANVLLLKIARERLCVVDEIRMGNADRYIHECRWFNDVSADMNESEVKDLSLKLIYNTLLGIHLDDPSLKVARGWPLDRFGPKALLGIKAALKKWEDDPVWYNEIAEIINRSPVIDDMSRHVEELRNSDEKWPWEEQYNHGDEKQTDLAMREVVDDAFPRNVNFAFWWIDAIHIAGAFGLQLALQALGLALRRNPDLVAHVMNELKEKQLDEEDALSVAQLRDLKVLEHVVHEIMRRDNAGALGVVYTAEEEVTTTILGKQYTFPRGTQCLYNLWSAGHDPNKFKCPYAYRVDRNLKDYVHFNGNDPRKRHCLGEPVAVLLMKKAAIALCKALDAARPDEVHIL